jgi:DNA repair protein RadC
MRTKLLANGPDGLADYEILEMLLFLGIPRRDTKPLAKETINRFGSLADTIAAGPGSLAHLGANSVVALKLVEEAASRLARAETLDRPQLNTWAKLTDYLDASPAPTGRAHLRVLFLDNRNRLLGDEVVLPARTLAEDAQTIVARALQLHATALITVTGPSESETKHNADIALAERLDRAADLLTIKLHEAVFGGRGSWDGLRRTGRLG